MAEREQLGRDIAKRHRVATVKALAQGLGQGDDLGPCLGVALATLHLVTVGALALAGAAQLRDQHRLFKFRDAAENLTDQPRSRRIVEECIGAIGSNKGDAALLEHGKADFLHHQVAGEAVGGLDHNGANAVAEQALQHRLEAGPCVDVIGAGNRLVVVLVDDLALGRLSAAGATIVDLPMAEFAQAAVVNPRGALTSAEAYWWHRQWMKDGADKYDPRVIVRIRPGETITAASYIELIKLREQFIRTINAAAAGYDAMLMPTAPETAPTIAETGKDDETYTRLNLRMLRNPTIVNLFDGCALSVPCHVPGTAPIGMMIAGTQNTDRKILAIGLAVEEVVWKLRG